MPARPLLRGAQRVFSAWRFILLGGEDDMTRVGLCFAAIQLFFFTSWTVYVIFLP